jgi:choline dehydrogenase-like flavoprotein
MTEFNADICVVGSGVAGAIVAKKCLDAGLTVVMVEAGKRADGRAFGLRVLEQIFRDYRIPRMRLWHRDALYARTDNLNPKYPVRGRALVVRGGTTLGWTGDAYRMLPEDFELFSRTGTGIDWPITYKELERHFGAIETILRVTGDETDPGHPERSSSFVGSPVTYHKRDTAFLAEFEDDGIGAMHHSMAHAKDGSVFTADELVDDLEQHAKFRLLLSTVADEIECSDAAKVDSLRCIHAPSGEVRRVHAGSVVVCASGIESPNLLLSSRNQWWPDGLGNHSGHLGHHLATHGGVAIGGRPRGLRYFDGPIVATAATRRFDCTDEQSRGKFLLIWRPAPTGYIFLNAIFEHFSNPANAVSPTDEFTKFRTRKSKIVFQAGETFVNRQREIAMLLEQMAGRMRLPVSNRRNYMLAHHMCTTRMALDPSKGVIDENLKVHNMQNLYVCGGSSFSSGGAANPTVTVAALAHRLGERLAAAEQNF